MKIVLLPQASVPALQATRHLRSPILLQTSTETFSFTQSTASPEQALMEEEEVATPKVSENFLEVQTSTAMSNAATAEELHNAILAHELGFLIALLLIWAPLDDASKGCLVFIKFRCH